MGLLVGPILSLSELSIPLLVSELEVHLLSGAEHVRAHSLVLLLSLLEDLIEVYGLLVVGARFLIPNHTLTSYRASPTPFWPASH